MSAQEILREMEPYIDIYMPDFKYIDARDGGKIFPCDGLF